MENTEKMNFRGAILNVPFAEKDAAKELGARWDPELKKWFVPRGVDSSPFAKWFEAQSNIDCERAK